MTYCRKHVLLCNIDDDITMVITLKGKPDTHLQSIQDMEVRIVMKDIELVVKIPEESYKLLKNEGVDWLGAEHILNAVANGTPLPEGHGDLKDSKKLYTRLDFILNHKNGYKESPIGTGIVIAMAEILDAEPIVKADRG